MGGETLLRAAAAHPLSAPASGAARTSRARWAPPSPRPPCELAVRFRPRARPPPLRGPPRPPPERTGGGRPARRRWRLRSSPAEQERPGPGAAWRRRLRRSRPPPARPRAHPLRRPRTRRRRRRRRRARARPRSAWRPPAARPRARAPTSTTHGVCRRRMRPTARPPRLHAARSWLTCKPPLVSSLWAIKRGHGVRRRQAPRRGGTPAEADAPPSARAGRTSICAARVPSGAALARCHSWYIRFTRSLHVTERKEARRPGPHTPGGRRACSSQAPTAAMLPAASGRAAANAGAARYA